MLNQRRIERIELDVIDRQLIEALDRNARTPSAELARLVGLSPQSTSDRVRRLEDLGVVTGFTVKLDPAALGLGIGAFIRIRPALGEVQRVAQLITELPEVVECDRITGDDCFIAKVFVAQMDGLERLIDRLLPYARTNTSIIQSSPVRRRQPPLTRRARARPATEPGRSRTVIIREWRGRADPANAAAYPAHFRTEVLPELRSLPGFLGATLSRRQLDGAVEFLVLTRWRSIEAIREFAGSDIAKAVVEPGAVAALLDFDATVQHYEVVEEAGEPAA